MAGFLHAARRSNLVVQTLVVGTFLFALSRAVAGDTEVRDFVIQVDGKSAGEYHMTIQRQGDGSVSMSAQSSVRVTVLAVPVYTYSYRGSEVWKGGRLQQFNSAGKENSKGFAVHAAPAADGLHVNANGQEHTAPADVWLTSCWQLPDAQHRNGPVVLMGCDNGLEINATLQPVGTEMIDVAGRQQTCTHYRLTREVPYELWFDGQDRLVRQDWTSGGHHTVISLAGVRE